MKASHEAHLREAARHVLAVSDGLQASDDLEARRLQDKADRILTALYDAGGTRRCKQCGREFPRLRQRRDTLYCSRPCRQRAWRKRRERAQ